MGLGSFLRGLLPGAGSSSGAALSPAALAVGRAGTSQAGTSQGAPARPSGSWRALPPIQRTVGAAPLVAPNAPFKAGLAAARPAPTALAPLRHDRGLQAPAGLVSGIATPIQRATGPVPASVRRRAGAGRSGAPAVAEEPGAWRLSDTSTAESAVWPAFGSGAEATPEPAPLLRAPAVAPVSGLPALTRASLATPVPGGRVGSRPAVARQAESGAPSPAPAALPGGSPAVPAPVSPSTPTAAAQHQGAAAASTSAAAAAASADPIVARSLDGGRPNLGQSRRLRVGAAITPVGGARLGLQLGLQRSTAALPVDGTGAGSQLPPLPAPALSAPDRAARPSAGAGPSAGWVAGPSAGATPLAGAVTATGLPAVSRLHGVAADPDDAAGPDPAAADAPPAAPSVPMRPLAVARSADAPLVGTLRPSIDLASPAVAIHVQPDVATGPVEEEGTPGAALAALAQVDQSAGIGQPGPAFGAPSQLFPGAPFAGGRLGTGLGPGAGGPTVARSIVAPSMPSSSYARWASAGTPATGVAAATHGRTIARAAPAASPMPAPALQRTMSWDPVNGMTTSSRSGPEPGPTGTVDAASAGATVTREVPAFPAIAPLVARSIDAAPALFAPVQREEVAAAPVAGGDEAAGAGTPAAGAMPEAQLDDLARRLHDKIAARLSRDLLIERERSGSLIDRGW